MSKQNQKIDESYVWMTRKSKKSAKNRRHFRDFEKPEHGFTRRHDLDEFFCRTTLAGFTQIATRSDTKWRIFWVLVALAGLTMSFYQSKEVLLDYINGKTIQMINYRNVRRMPFPSLTVCSNIRWNFKFFNQSVESLEPFISCANNYCVRNSSYSITYGQKASDEDSLVKRLIQYQADISSNERGKLFYGSYTTFVKECIWKNELCNMSDPVMFYYFNTLYNGPCLTFNPGVNSVLNGGENRELVLTLKMDRRSRRLKFNEVTASFWIHDPGTAPPLYSDNNGRIFVGDKIRLEFSMRNITRIESNACLVSVQEKYQRLNVYYKTEMPYHYDQSSCIYHQEIKLSTEAGCYHVAVPYTNVSELMRTAGINFCMTRDCARTCIDLTEDQSDRIRTYCKPSCTEIPVQFSSNTVSLLIENLVEKSMFADIEDSDDIENNESLRKEFRNRTIAIIQLTPGNNIMEEIVEEWKYSVSDFLGILGGNFGLWTGISVVALAELLELLYIFILLLVEKSKLPKVKIIKKGFRKPLTYTISTIKPTEL